MSQALYSSLSLESNTIRLLRILPNENEEADINCTLFVYPLHDSGRGTHRYEALSYVWGDADDSRSICVNGHRLTVRANLHIALSRLRDPVLDRIIWIDAICINQEDLNERGHQVQLMAKIYSKASQVVIWLGEAADNSDRALGEIVIAVNQSEISSDKTARKAVLALLQRPWFRRIWVLQEVAAARHILIMCGLIEIDGYAFCAGLNASKAYLKAYPRLQRLIRSVIYLMKEAALRPKHAKSSSNNFSLDIRPLSELIETYYTRESTDDLDKVYALLAMCSDSPMSAGLLPDYTIVWEQLFQQLVQFILCKEIDVRLPQDKNMAMIRSKGCVLGWVDSVLVDAAWNDTVKVEIVSSGTLEHPGRERQRITTFTFPTVERYIEKDDIVCLLQGVSKPTIIRAHKDHFSVIMIAATPLDFISEEQSKWLKDVRSTTIFPRNFSLVWDLRGAKKRLGGLECENLRVPINIDPVPEEESEIDEIQRAERDLGTEKRGLSDILFPKAGVWKFWGTNRGKRKGAEARDYSESDWSSEAEGHTDIEEFSAIDQYLTSDDFSEIESKTLDETIALYKFALVLKDLKNYERAEKLLLQVIQERKKQLGTEHLQTLSSIDVLQSVYREQGLLEGTEKLEAMKNLIETPATRVSEEEVVEIASLSSCKAMMLILERRGGQVPITEEVVKAAAANKDCGIDMIKLLLRGRKDLSITEGLIQVAVGNVPKRYDILKLLFQKSRNQIPITEEIVKRAVKTNKRESDDILEYLFEKSGNPISITEEIVKAAAGNHWRGDFILKYLFEKSGNQFPITEEVLKAAAENERHGYNMMELFFEKKGNQFPITEEVLKAVVGNERHGYDMMTLLFQRKGNQFPITEEVLDTAVGNKPQGYKILNLIFERKGEPIFKL
ncbi:hypothetical protein BGAL_0289g00170 [Botrytis galanthina]|uniref:Heterokaryon incompatibility domain-containing protein n=1 Tax=Botrytis galanthina TaxID=278940 RepID=A0A4S8R174_9HELO|nr:hypothetical protein BGAL_0289g00170 [Botrytis galanthina]